MAKLGVNQNHVLPFFKQFIRLVLILAFVLIFVLVGDDVKLAIYLPLVLHISSINLLLDQMNLAYHFAKGHLKPSTKEKT